VPLLWAPSAALAVKRHGRNSRRRDASGASRAAADEREMMCCMRGELVIAVVQFEGDQPLSEAEVGTLRGMASNMPVSLSPGSVGKGWEASVTFVAFELAERVINDFGSLLGVGAAVAEVVRWLKSRGRSVLIDDENTIAVLAAAQNPSLHDELLGAVMLRSVCLTSGGGAMGSDENEVWSTSFQTPSGWLLLLFTSSSGVVLGHARVPLEWHDGRQRSAEDLLELCELGDEKHRPNS
jgi:hypothetical protein